MQLFQGLAFVPWLLSCVSPTLASLPSSFAQRSWAGPKPRTLAAASSKSSLRSRDIDSCLGHDLELYYVDNETHGTPDQFAARVRMSTHIPTVILEEVEHHFSDIVCTESSIHLHFDDLEVMKLVHQEFHRAEEFMVVTSHDGCNNNGERGSYLTSGIGVSKGHRVISMSTTPLAWEYSVNSITVDFGPSNDPFQLRRHDTLLPRQDSVNPIAAATTGLSSISYPSPTVTPTETNVAPTIDWHRTDLVILGETADLGDVGIVGPLVPPDVELSCTSCSITGDLQLTSGSITMNMSDIHGPHTFYDYGYIEFLSNNFSAHIELDTSFVPTARDIYTKKLPTIPLTPFLIPGVASIGPQLTPVFSMGVKLFTELDFTYGFDIDVPDNSYVKLVVGNITDSVVSGFNETSVTALPFNAKVDGLNLTIFAGFKPQLELGMTILNGAGTLGGGVFLDIPSLSAQVFDVEKVHTNCEPATNSSTVNSVLGDILGTFTNIIPSLNFDFGFQIEGSIDVGDWAVTAEKIWPEASIDLALPTTCLAFDKGASSYGPASALGTSTGTGGASSAPKSGGTVARLTEPSLMALLFAVVACVMAI